MGKKIIRILFVLSMAVFALKMPSSAFAETGKWEIINKGLLGYESFYYPSGIAIDANDNIYVADTYSDRIQVYEVNTGIWTQMCNYIINIEAYSKKLGSFNRPSSVASDSNGNIYVSDNENSRIQKYTKATNKWSWFSKNPGSSLGQFLHPGGIAVGFKGNVYVSDGGNKRIQKYNKEMNTWSIVEKTMVGNGKTITEPIYSPYIALDSSENLYTVDLVNNSIQILNNNTNTWSYISYNTGYPYKNHSISGIAVDKKNNIYLTDRLNDQVVMFDITSNEWTALGITSLSKSSEPGVFNDPSGIAIDTNDNIYVADTQNSRIQRFVTTKNQENDFSQNKKIVYTRSSNIQKYGKYLYCLQGKYLFRLNESGKIDKKVYCNEDITSFIIKDNWIYIQSSYYIKKIKVDFSESYELVNDHNIYISDFAIGGNYIYFVGQPSIYKPPYVYKRNIATGIFRMHLDGTEITRLIEGVADNLICSDEDLYYMNTQTLRIHHIDLKNKTNYILGNDIQGSAQIYDDNIYFIKFKDNYTLHKINRKGGNDIKLGGDEVLYNSHLYVSNGWIYYANRRDKLNLYRMKLDGSERTKICNISINGAINLYEVEGWIYLVDRNSKDFALYKVKNDGTSKKILCNLDSIEIRNMKSINVKNIKSVHSIDNISKLTITNAQDIYLSVAASNNNFEYPKYTLVTYSDGTQGYAYIKFNVRNIEIMTSGDFAYDFRVFDNNGLITKHKCKLFLKVLGPDNLVSSVNNIKVNLKIGDNYELPKNIEATMGNGQKKLVPITFEEDTNYTTLVDITKEGSRTYYGSIVGYCNYVEIIVNVKE